MFELSGDLLVTLFLAMGMTFVVSCNTNNYHLNV